MAIFILKHSSAAVARRTETAMLPQSSMRDHGPVFRTALVFIVFTCATIYNILQNQFVTYENPGAAANPPPSYFSTVNDISHDDDYEIVTTDYGWTTDKRDQFSQRKVSEEFFNAILSHPKYNPKTSWEELGKNPDPSKRLVVFLDIDTCIECNYPNYGATLTDNLAITVKGEKWHEIIRKSCSHIRRAAESPALKANKDSRLIILDCGDAPYYRLLDVCDPAYNSRAASSGGWGDVLNNSQVIIASYGARQQDSRDVDIGLPPPAVKPMELLPYERYWIETCKSERRHYMFSFQGRGGFRRDRLKHLDNGHDIIVRIKDPESYWNTTGDIFNYGEVLRNSLFSAAPRGDCLYSYRFTEMMSAGTIPVVYADDWLPPFASRADPNRVLNWTKCAVFIREYALFDTVKILNMTPDDVRCEMQQCSLAFWDEFGSSREGWLRGILRWVNSDPGICKN